MLFIFRTCKSIKNKDKLAKGIKFINVVVTVNEMEELSRTSIKELIQNIHLMILPSTLWALHVDPEFKFICVLHINVAYPKVNIDKGVIVTAKEDAIDVSTIIYGDIVNVPTLMKPVKTVSDLSFLIYIVDDVKLCNNSQKRIENPNCQMYITSGNNSFCKHCEINYKHEIKLDVDEPKLNINELSVDLNYEQSDYLNNQKNKDVEMVCENSFETISKFCSDVRNGEEIKCENVSDIQPTKLRSHKRRENKKQHACKFCDKSFLTKRFLRDHLNLHKESQSFVCNVCNKTCSQRSTYQRHLRIHNNIKPNLCNVCGKTFCQGYRMEDHLLTHSNDRPFECITCKKRFAKSYNLKLHQKTHLGTRPYICSQCGKTYTTQSNLSTHMMSVHTKVKPHPCTSCPKSFVHPHLLKIHMRKHTGEKPYKCLICGKTFAKNIHLTVHTRIHTGERPHVCTICEKGFTTTGNLNSHKRVHHKDVIVDALNK